MARNYSDFEANTDRLIQQINESCRKFGRDPLEVKLMAVTKANGPEAVDWAAQYGLEIIGENRIQEAVAKKPLTRSAIRWELIGHLQSNKARLAVQTFDRIQTVDRIKLVRVLDRHCGELGKKMAVLLEVNTGRDPNKTGASPDDVEAVMEAVLKSSWLKPEGLMTIAPLDGEISDASRSFAALRELSEKLSSDFGIGLPELSMGMTGDFEEALREGSTLIRVGTALFGVRTVKQWRPEA